MSDSAFQYFRTMVSGKKKRFIQDGFNLDLTYITERIIAMGYPADTIHKLFRNDIDHVYNFFETYHPGHWLILNVAQEISYKSTKLGGNVIFMGFEDHTPPPFLYLLQIIEVMTNWLNRDPRNVIAIHCKAGKGRTGTIISCYLISILKLNCPDVFYRSDSILYNTLSFFNTMRSNEGECITVPSQKRYIGYYIQFLREEVPYSLLLNPVVYRIVNIECTGQFSTSNLTSIEFHLNYNPSRRGLPIIVHKNNSRSFIGQNYLKFEPTRIINVCGDTLLKFNQSDSAQCIFKLLFHTSFIPIPDSNASGGPPPYTSLCFSKNNFDGAQGGLFQDYRFKDDFTVKILFELVPQPPMNSCSSTVIQETTSIIQPPYIHQHQQQQQQIFFHQQLHQPVQSVIPIITNFDQPPPIDRSTKPKNSLFLN
eukprot:gene1953-2389_t